jgi:hypothetical protein
MAHNIGQMFYFGERPWHKLGTKLDKPATIEEALSAGGLDWTVSMQPLVLANEHESDAPQRQAIVRDDIKPGQIGRVLGVVHPNFKVLQNRDGALLFDSLTHFAKQIQPNLVISPAEKNWWGGLNSITAWVDHVSEVDGDRYANAMFGGPEDRGVSKNTE